LNKPKTKPKRKKQPFPDVNRQPKKELFLVYDAYCAFASACEQTFPPPKEKAEEKPKEKHKEKREDKHIRRQIVKAESWSERDLLFRRLAAQCYEDAQFLKKTGDLKQAAKWMNLCLRFCRLSLDPKAKQQMGQMLAELRELKTAMKEHEQKQEEEDDAESD